MTASLQQLTGLQDALLNQLQVVLSTGRPLSDSHQGLIAQQLAWLEGRIEELEGFQQPEPEEENEADGLTPPVPPNPSVPTGGEVPELEAAPHESSNINAFRYNPANGQLFVKFQGKFPSQDGPVYSYEGVPKNIYDLFSRGAVAPKTSGSNSWHTWKEGVTPSHGASMYALIRQGAYPYQRVR
jgi:hypothetical protein